MHMYTLVSEKLPHRLYVYTQYSLWSNLTLQGWTGQQVINCVLSKERSEALLHGPELNVQPCRY